jgi:hypothetical protein
MVGGDFTFPLSDTFRTGKELSEILQCLVVMLFIDHSLFAKTRTMAAVTLRQPRWTHTLLAVITPHTE